MNTFQPIVFNSHALIARLSACLVALILLTASGMSWAQVEISAIPSSFSAGARIKVNVSGLALSTNYRLRLEQVRPGVTDFDLIDFASGSRTNLSVSAAIPSAPAGSYEIVLYRVQLGLTRLGATAVTVGASPVVTLTPTQGPPGRRVTINVTNLVTGSLRVLYAGQTILGPVPVGTAYSGRFLVPSDRPTNLPATVPVVIENLVGRLVVRRATVNFQAQAPSGLPRLGFQTPQVPSAQVSPRTPFAVSGRLQDDAGLAPAGRQQLYFIGGGVTVPVDTGINVDNNGNLQVQARAPDAFLDGISSTADRPGNLVLVNQGLDRDTDTNRDGVFQSQNATPVIVDGRDAGSATFTLVVRGFQSGGGGPLLSGVIVEADANFQTAFFGSSGVPSGQSDSPQGSSEYQGFGSALANQLQVLEVMNAPNLSGANYGCPVTFFRRITAAQGRATFVISPADIADINFNDINGQFNCPQPPCNVSGDQPNGVQLNGEAFTGRANFLMNVYAVHLGYRNTAVAIEYDGDTGQFTDQSTGQPFVNNTLEVALEPSADSDFDLRNLRIDGVGPPERIYPPGDCPQSSGGVCYHNPARYQSMYSYPDTARWPSSAFDAFNSGRKARLTIDTQIYGPLSFGRIRIGNTAWANFNASGTTPGCVLEASTEAGAGEVEYIANLPDLTRLPTGTINGEVEVRFGTNLRTFPIKLYTAAPGVDRLNPNVATLRINALTDVISGTYNTEDLDIPVDSPGHGVGRLDSMSENDGSFSLRRNADGQAINDITSTTNNDVAANPGGPKAVSGAFFGFINSNHNEAAPITLFDTGIIPLFRYTFGLPPIAAATLGADFWMAATLAYYGQLQPQGMNATIDPRLAGGVDLFFDLDILFGIVSGSMRAESELGIAMRAKINQGGFAHLSGNPSLPAGRCFTFDLDGVWEACAVGICAGGRENLINVREPDNCANSPADAVPLMLRRSAGLSAQDDPQSITNFDLTRPLYTATALGGDGRGHAISVGVNSNGDVIASHITGGVVMDTNTIARSAVAVQHLDIAFYATNRAMAVWSENTRTQAEVVSLMQSQRERAFDDIARTQRLRFSQWDGLRWSAPANLTSIGNDGKPQLAGCLGSPRFTTSACPGSGEITAVWERDANQNLDAPDLEIWSARWRPDGRGWVNVARVSDPGVSSDMHASVAYRQATAIVAWAHNPGGAFVTLSRRIAAYRFLDGSAQVNASALGAGVGWVDIGVSAADDVVIAYTRGQDANGFVGNRQALSVARSSSCAAGVCTFQVTEVRDPAQRQFRVERPRVAFDETDTPMIGFRALAYGPDALGRHALPGDLPGILLGTGEVAMVHVHSFAQPRYTAQIVGLSDNGLQHWKPDFVYDETMGGVLAVSMQSAPPVGLRTPMEIAQMFSPEGSPVAAQASALAGGAMLRMAMGGADFEVRNARLSRSVVTTGQTLRLDLDLVNIGSSYVPAEHGALKVVASLNGPAGTGVALGNFNLISNATSNASRAVSINLTLPAGVRADERQTIFVDIVAGDDANSVDGTADHDRIEVNAVPIPTNLNASVRADSPFVSLVWANPNDTRVAGWRIWKLDANGNWQHLGSTPVPGYFDITATINAQMTYRVAAYSANGMESEPSESISAFIRETRTVGIFGNGFEVSVP